MKPKRQSYSPQQKANAVRMHLRQRKPVSEIADELNIHPTMINGWIRIVLEKAEMAFEDNRSTTAKQRQTDKKFQKLQQRIDQKNEVIAELIQENIQAKKTVGSAEWSMQGQRKL
ncbi:MAG: transposase [Planctomycetota bacterium]